MVRRSPVRGSVALAALLGFTAACSESGSRLPAAPSAPGVPEVTISGPDRLAPGQTAQYTATIRLADGTLKLPSPETDITWHSSSPSVLMSEDGFATAVDVGETAVAAVLGTTAAGRATKEVVVVPDGTYRLVGVVRDAEFPEVRVNGARVEVTPGGLTAVSGGDGRYRLYGVPAEAEVRITAPGYEPFVTRLQLDGHAAQDADLTLTSPRVELSGAYTLTVDMVEECSELSPPLQHRRYDAVVTQSGSKLDVTLTSPEFTLGPGGRGNRFSGHVAGSGASFRLDSLSFYYDIFYEYLTYPNVAERLADGAILVPDGTAVVEKSAAGLSGRLNGGITAWRYGPFPVSLGGCRSTDILFALARR